MGFNYKFLISFFFLLFIFILIILIQKNFYKRKIPKIIHQSWKTADVSTYSDGKIGVKSQQQCKLLYPDYKYMFWTDDDIQKYVSKNKIYLDTFNNLDQKIKKMDFFRYLILYEYGGIWCDMDFIFTKKLPDSMFYNYDFIGYKAPRPKTNQKFVLGQAFFVCCSKHEGIKKIIQDIIINKNDNKHPLLHTGPEKINKIFIENNLLYHKSTKILEMHELSHNKLGTYGGHIFQHQW